MQQRSVEILLVEDNPADADLTREALKDWKIVSQLHIVEDGVEAIDFLYRHGNYTNSPRPDIILLDLNLPKMDGREVLKEIKSDPNLRTIPVVALSTSDAEIDIWKSYGLGANCYVTKPFSFDSFVKIVHSIGNFWFTVVKLPSNTILSEPHNLSTTASNLNDPYLEKKVIDVVIIEDNDPDAEYVKEILSDSLFPIFKTIHFSTLKETLHFLHSHRVDVILCDLSLPDSDGLFTYEQLQKVVKHIPIIILSGNENESLAIKAVHKGAQDFLVKGHLEFDLLKRVIRYAIERKWLDEEMLQLLQREQNARADSEKATLARDEFISVASHELKTPITALKMQTQLFNRQLERDTQHLDIEKVKTFLQRITKDTDRLISLIANLLDVTKIHAGRLDLNLERINLIEVVTSILESLGPQLQEANCQLELVKMDSLIGNWDRFRIEQILFNLLINAMKYGQGKPIRVTMKRTDNSAQISIHDNGPGIRLEDQSRIFGRFERLNVSKTVQGLGLGLYIVRQIVDAHGGTIKVESKPGEGSTFTIDLPLPN